MPHYYFNFRRGTELMRDLNGIALDNTHEAYLEAYAGAQEIWADMIKTRKDPTSCAFEIVDEAGSIILTLPFTEILDHCVGKLSPEPSPRSVGKMRLQVERSRRLRSELASQFECLKVTLGVTRKLLARQI